MPIRATPGETSRIIRMFIQEDDSLSGKTGLAYNTASLTAYYSHEGDSSATAFTLATATVGTYTSSGFVEVDATNMPGVYEFGIPNARISSAGVVDILFKGATGMAPCAIKVETYAAPLTAAEVNTEVDAGLSDIRLDELMSVALASQPAAGSLLGDLTEDDAGTQRFIANALEEAPTGGGGGGDATAAKQDQIIAAVITNAAGVDIAADIIALKAETALIVADTNELQMDDTPAAIAALDTKIDTIDGIVDSILIDTAEIGAAGAGLTALATQASVNTIDSNVDSILVDTAEIGVAGAGLTALATQTSVNTIDGIVDSILVDTGTTLPATLAGLATQASVDTVDTVVDGIATDQTTIKNRLGSWTGSSVNTVLGAMQAIMSTSATLPSDIGGGMDPSTDSLQGIRDRGDAAWTTGTPATGEVTAADIEGIRYMLNLDGTQTEPAVAQAARLEVNATAIEGGDPSDLINAACDTAMTDYGAAVPTDVTDSETVITNAIAALNDISAGDVLTQVNSALTTYDPPTHAELTADTDALAATLAGFNDISASDVLTQATAALTTYDPPTNTEMLAAHTATDALISGLNDISASDVLAQASAALTAYDAPTNTEMLAATAVTDALIGGLNDLSAVEVNGQLAAALATYDVATVGDLVTGSGATPSEVLTQVTNALNTYDAPTNTEMLAAHAATDALISGLNDLSPAQVNTEVDTALADYDGPTKAELDAGLAALNDVAASDVLAQATAALNAYDAPTRTEATADKDEILADIAALENIAVGDIQAQVVAALGTYDAVTQSDLDTAEANILSAVPSAGGTVSLAVSQTGQTGGETVLLKRGNPDTLTFTGLSTITMSDVLLGISDDAGRSMLKLEGTILTSTSCSFSISTTQALALTEGNFNLDVFELDNYDSDTGSYDGARNLVSGDVTIQPLYLRLENS